jgi:hypothetical protein
MIASFTFEPQLKENMTAKLTTNCGKRTVKRKWEKYIYKHSTHRTPLIWRLREPDQGSTVSGLLSVSPPEEHHERRTFSRRGGNPRTCDSGSAIDS